MLTTCVMSGSGESCHTHHIDLTHDTIKLPLRQCVWNDPNTYYVRRMPCSGGPKR
jgi:hypothetical protein